MCVIDKICAFIKNALQHRHHRGKCSSNIPRSIDLSRDHLSKQFEEHSFQRLVYPVIRIVLFFFLEPQAHNCEAGQFRPYILRMDIDREETVKETNSRVHRPTSS
jgi:hypothetical protein